MENINFWQPPFKQWYEYSWYTYDAHWNFCFQIDIETLSVERDKKMYQKILRILNGESKEKINAKLKIIDGYKIILNDNTPFITIRWWGYLTGCGGGLCLEPEKAKQIQDNLALFIFNKLLWIT